MSYNQRHQRHGQLFQNRFKSIICQEDAYLQELVRYIHLNPLRQKIVSDLKELEGYAYCGHSVLVGRKKRDWQDVKYVLGYFGKGFYEARENYRSYVNEGVSGGRRPELVGGGLIRSLCGWDAIKKTRLTGQDRIKSDQRILGDSDFVKEVLAESEESLSRKYVLKSLGFDFEKVLEKVSALFKLEKEYIISKGRQQDRVRARDLLCYWTAIELGIPMVALAKKLGMTLAAVSYAVQRGERIAKEEHHSLDDRDI